MPFIILPGSAASVYLFYGIPDLKPRLEPHILRDRLYAPDQADQNLRGDFSFLSGVLMDRSESGRADS